MKRRDFLILGGLSGFGLALIDRKFINQKQIVAATCPQTETSRIKPRFRFVSLADVGMGNKGQYAVAQAMNCYWQQNAFPLVLLAGDNIYPGGEIDKVKAVFEQPYQSLLKQGVRFQAVLGNHDIITNNGEDELRYQDYNMQGRYYTFTQDSVQFFALDTNDNAPWDEQLTWLEENLARSQSRWKIVYGHHPVYSSGLHGGSQFLNDRLTPLFSRYQVQLYICGHDHNYERSKNIQGTTYIVCGAGAGTRPVSRSDWTAFSADILSFVGFEVYEKVIKIKAIDSTGKVFDKTAIFNS
ncbi:metallophosphoesterase [Stanieria cyanosphaera PCC 7437]|uniref:Metallophosphoesterase n=1 Tax=Stanieria cyanosphaera (strain ATCC 29371 / PCC 7437) TaxID=111780 RepID=K9XWG6_STAC7|nr:metallophosphoesterase [Stanieria cyanosphaera]AFZ36873.1 metallophosphoesterase [Stanieria cyanosphaera PCC 7437]